MVDIISWIMNNTGQLWLIFSSVVTIASIIVKLTPTQKDDEVLGKILKLIKWVSLNTSSK